MATLFLWTGVSPGTGLALCPLVMHPLPHLYSVTSHATPTGGVTLMADGLPALQTAAPPEFDGPAGCWSPETLQVAAAVDCFVLTFRGLARVARLPWTSLECLATGILDRVDRNLQFTDFLIQARLTVPEGVGPTEAERILARADETCLIASSLKGAMRLEVDVKVDVKQEVGTPA